MASQVELSQSEQDELIALSLTDVLVGYFREHSLVGSVVFDGCELLVSWRAAEADDA